MTRVLMTCAFPLRQTVVTIAIVGNYPTITVLLYPMCCMRQLLAKDITNLFCIIPIVLILFFSKMWIHVRNV